MLTNGCEIWGYENVECIEKVHNEFLRKFTRSKRRTPMYMVYSELGRHPISVNISCRMLNVLSNLITGKQENFSFFCISICSLIVIKISNGCNILNQLYVTLAEMIFG